MVAGTVGFSIAGGSAGGGTAAGLCRRCRAKSGAVHRYHAPARQPVPPDRGRRPGFGACLRSRAGAGRRHPGTPDQLFPGPHHPVRRHRHRRKLTPLCHHRSARRPRFRHRRLQGRERSRRRPRAGHPVYFVIFRHPSGAGPDPGRHLPRPRPSSCAWYAAVIPTAPKPVVVGNCQGGWAAMLLAARQSRPDRPGGGQRLAFVLLVGGARAQSHALSRRHGRRRPAGPADSPISAVANSTAPIWC